MAQEQTHGHRLVFSTFPTLAVAKKISRTLLEKQWIACANIIPGLTSMYRWKDTIEESSEILCMFKTTSTRVDDVLNCIDEFHPYECPEGIVCTIDGGLPHYLEWISNSIQEQT